MHDQEYIIADNGPMLEQGDKALLDARTIGYNRELEQQRFKEEKSYGSWGCLQYFPLRDMYLFLIGTYGKHGALDCWEYSITSELIENVFDQEILFSALDDEVVIKFPDAQNFLYSCLVEISKVN